MKEKYPEAARRHLEDSCYLLDGKRWDNCAYLAGYVIECSIKAVVSHPTMPPGLSWSGDGHDLGSLLFQLEQMAASRKSGYKRAVSSGMIGALRTGINTCNCWHPRMRYGSSGIVTEAQARKWLQIAKRSFSGLAKHLCAGDSV